MSSQESDRARTLLEHVPALQSPCDLDLLVFIAQHPRTLMSIEQLEQLLGYGVHAIARSLDALIAAGFLTRTHNPAHLARMYRFATDAANGSSLLAVVDYASTRGGRLALRQALTASIQSMALQAGA